MRRWRILALDKTDVYVHPSLAVAAIYAAAVGHAYFFAVSLVSIILHEAAHALTALCMGKAPAEIVITPFGCMMRLEEDNMPMASQQVLILMAGPGATLMLMALSVKAVMNGGMEAELARMLFLSNAGILSVNLLPALPLDGGRVLALFLRRVWSEQIAAKTMRVLGRLLGFLLIVGNVAVSWRYGGWNFSLGLAGCCLLYAASAGTAPNAMIQMRRYMERKIRLERKGHLAVRHLSVLHTLTLQQLVRRLPDDKMICYHVFELGSMRFLGSIWEQNVISRYLSEPHLICGELVCAKTEQKTAQIEK